MSETLSDDAFLGGRLRLLQPKDGFRAGLDAVMLAAAIPARAGERVLEAGLGNGAASLCLLRRVDDCHGVGVEIDEATAALAIENAARNGLDTRLNVVIADVEQPTAIPESLPQNAFDHVFANPPFHRAVASRAPAHAGKARAHQRANDGLERWLRFLVGRARPGATLTLILPAPQLDEAMALLPGRLGDLAVFPLFPRVGAPASRILLQGRKGSRAPLRLLQGLVLHGEGHDFTPEADAILRHGAAIDLGTGL